MAYPKELRKQLGLSMPALATLIKCNRSLLSMVEIGKRQLPNQSLGPLAAMFKAASKQSPNVLPVSNSAATNQWLKRELRNAKTSLQHLQLKQEKLDEQLLQVQHWLGMAAAMDADIFAANSTAKLQFQLLNRKATQKQQQLHLGMCKLKVSMAQQAAAISTLEEWIGQKDN